MKAQQEKPVNYCCTVDQVNRHSLGLPNSGSVTEQACAMLCCVQLINSDKPCFLLHTTPASWESCRRHTNNLAQTVSRAGEGPGLQVFPDSVQVVAPVSGWGLRWWSLLSLRGLRSGGPV